MVLKKINNFSCFLLFFPFAPRTSRHSLSRRSSLSHTHSPFPFHSQFGYIWLTIFHMRWVNQRDFLGKEITMAHERYINPRSSLVEKRNLCKLRFINVMSSQHPSHVSSSPRLVLLAWLGWIKHSLLNGSVHAHTKCILIQVSKQHDDDDDDER